MNMQGLVPVKVGKKWALYHPVKNGKAVSVGPCDAGAVEEMGRMRSEDESKVREALERHRRKVDGYGGTS